ncbi:MAG: radical SAM protein [Micropruina sp.]|nr:radical SAM protein [Micropruina sp.]
MVTNAAAVTSDRRTQLAITLVDVVGRLATGTTAMIPVESPAEVGVVDAWCRGNGHSVLAVHADAVEVYRGRLSDLDSKIPTERMPGRRLWLYANFHCNLACDYCCVSSSPKADPRALGVDTVAALVAEAVTAGAVEVLVTGGEPLMHPAIDEVVGICAAALPTVMLTNAMLFRGSRLRLLDALPRDGLTLQVSLDSATPGLHDAHRGAGTWLRAVEGIRVARSMGFTVRIAMTVSRRDDAQEEQVRQFAASMGISPEHMVVRHIARQGEATSGIVLSRATLVPEVCNGRGCLVAPCRGHRPGDDGEHRLDAPRSEHRVDPRGIPRLPPSR